MRNRERQIIEKFVAKLPSSPPPHGPGDDAALLRSVPKGFTACVTVDATVEGVHFSRPAFSLEDIGHKALAVNLSDLAAMGAAPAWWLCALGVPDTFAPRHAARLAEGMRGLARSSGAKLAGGNVTRSKVLSLTITACGHAKRPLLRTGGRAGHVLYVTGSLGLAARGLEQGANAEALQAQRRPAPRLDLGETAARFASAGLDISDGLLLDLERLCEASRVGAQIDSARIPVGRGATLQHALTGGEDYQLLLAVPKAMAAGFERKVKDATRIGTLVRTSGVFVDGSAWKGPRGFTH